MVEQLSPQSEAVVLGVYEEVAQKPSLAASDRSGKAGEHTVDLGDEQGAGVELMLVQLVAGRWCW
ncbi:MAG: hypothetical protein R2710_07645 [Acidimicrobiales bacterium]